MKRLLLVLLLLSFNAFAEVPFTIEADTVETPEESVYHAKGNVKVFQGDRTLLADEIYYNKETNIIKAYDNVKLMEPGRFFTCDEMEFNADDQSGTFTNTKAFMEPYHWLSASKLDRHNEYSYGMEDATYSTCSGERPDWSFKSKKADLNIGGYLTSKHTTARVKNVPVFYAPYFIYPVKTERESGFLVPDFGYSSDMGVYAVPKFFWNISVDQDVTVGAVTPSMNSPLLNMEHRYAISSNENIYTYLEYTADERTHPDDKNNNFSMTEEKGRFLLYNEGRVKLTQKLSFQSYIKAFSDYDYIDDYNKFNNLVDFEENKDIYKSTLTLHYNSKYSDVQLNYIDEMDYTVGSLYTKEHTYSKPNLRLYKNITTTPVFLKYKFDYNDLRYTRYTHSYNRNRKSTTDYSLKRENLNLKFYKPINLYIATLTPSIEIRKTRWHSFTDGYRLTDSYRNSRYSKIRASEDSVYRDTYLFSHSLAFNEIYKNYDSFKHSIYNTIYYKQSPYLNESRIPDLLTQDRMEQVRQYKYKLDNYFTSRNWNLRISNSYVYNQINEDDDHDSHIGEIRYRFKNFSTTLKHELDLIDHEDELFQAYTGIKFKNLILSASYTYDKGEYSTTDDDNNTAANFSLQYVSDKYDVEYTRSMSGMNKVMTTDNLTETTDILGLTYKSECWNFTVSYERETDPDTIDPNRRGETEHSIMFTISLKGLSSSKHGYRGTEYNLNDEEDNENEI